jgi:radical SAM superfamily enzyme YgiQ (UPF0313 family)
MSLKIALINPFNSFLSDNKTVEKLYHQTEELSLVRFYRTGPVLALLALAGLEDRDIEYRYIDERYEPVVYEEKYDIVAMSLMALQAPKAYQMAAEFKKRGAYIVMGGLHPTVLPAETGQHADSVFIGEAELTWPQFIRDFRSGKPQKYYENKETVDLAVVPAPKYDIIASMTSRYPDVPLQVSRGCPHDCSFCTASKIYGFNYRQKTISQTIKELEKILEIYPKKPSIWFTDDNMFANKKFGKELMRALIPYRIIWHTQTDLSIAEDEELLKLIYQAGGWRILVGLESIIEGNLECLDSRNWKFRKYKTNHGYADAISKIQSHGIGIIGAFMIGLEKDTKATFQKTVDFVHETNLYGTQITVLTPMPGTDIYDAYKAAGRLLHEDWSRYTYVNVNFTHPNLSKQELEDGLLYIYYNVYNAAFFKQKAMYFKNAIAHEIETKQA